MESQAARAEADQQWQLAARYYLMASRAAQGSGRMQKALVYAKKAFELSGKTQNYVAQASAAWRIGGTLTALRAHDEAKGWLERGLDVAGNIGNRGRKEQLQALFLRTLAVIDLRENSPREAIEKLNRALELHEGSLQFANRGKKQRRRDSGKTSQHQTVRLLSMLGRAHWKTGNDAKALEFYERASRLITEAGLETFEQAAIDYGVGQLYLTRGENDRAREHLESALAAADKFDLPAKAIQAHSALGNLDLRTRRPSAAIGHFRQAIAGMESVRSLLESVELRESFLEDKRQMYAGMITAQLRVGNIKQAFDYNERARSRAFLDLLGNKVQLARKEALIEEERELQAKISALAAQLEEDDDAPRKSELGKEIGQAKKAYDDFLAKVRAENPEQASLMSVEPLTSSEVQEYLDPNVTLLEYFVSRNRVSLWVVEKKRFRHIGIAVTRAELVSNVRSFRKLVGQLGDPALLDAQGRELFRILIEPALPFVTGKELVIVPHDALHYLPFHALVSGDNKYLVQDYPLHYLSSASLMKYTGQKRRASRERALALGNPDLGDPSKALQFAEVEAMRIKGSFPQTTLLLKKEATEENTKALSPGFDILHFAAHAELNEADPMSSAVLLARGGREDGNLEVREVFGMSLHADLVVLSGCETGLGKLSTGDELVGLTRAFIYAGTPSVIASLWKVDDSSTAQLMAGFYRHLKKMSKAEALREAQLEMIQGGVGGELIAQRGVGGVTKGNGSPGAVSLSPGPVSSSGSQSQISVPVSSTHPYFWAPFILVGEG